MEIRSTVRKGFFKGKMYHLQDGKTECALLGSSNLTVPGLGLQASGNNIELTLVVSDDRDRKDLLVWFNDLNKVLSKTALPDTGIWNAQPRHFTAT